MAKIRAFVTTAKNSWSTGQHSPTCADPLRASVKASNAASCAGRSVRCAYTKIFVSKAITFPSRSLESLPTTLTLPWMSIRRSRRRSRDAVANRLGFGDGQVRGVVLPRSRYAVWCRTRQRSGAPEPRGRQGARLLSSQRNRIKRPVLTGPVSPSVPRLPVTLSLVRYPTLAALFWCTAASTHDSPPRAKATPVMRNDTRQSGSIHAGSA